MSRLLLLFLFLLWMTAAPDPRPAGSLLGDGSWPSPVLPALLFLGGYAVLVGAMGLWARMLARRVGAPRFTRKLRLFNTAIVAARVLVVTWFGYGVFVLGWADVVENHLGMGRLGDVRLPALLLGTLPALAAWAGLWWSQYPADRALREQNLLSQLHDELPLHAPPSFRSYFATNLRLQLLFTVVPILMISAVHDVAVILLGDLLPTVVGGASLAAAQTADAVVWLSSSALVFLLAPEVLRRVLKTTSLPESPLRRRLEGLCRRAGMRYRDILLWHTDHNMGNAAVMGVIPQVRYVLLSDVLLETMDDDQVEAVFAHEVGHVVHRHLSWFVVFFALIFLFLFLAGAKLAPLLEYVPVLSPLAIEIAGLALAMAAFYLAFGYLSRWFERQADVYAARTLQGDRRGPRATSAGPQRPQYTHGIALAGAGPHGGGVLLGTPNLVTAGGGATIGGHASAADVVHDPHADPRGGDAHGPDPASFVGHYGATLFASALHRVAKVNNIPVAKHEWLHGSIARRMQYLRDMSQDPARTGTFDRKMLRLYAGLLFALFATTIWAFTTMAR